LFVHVLILLFLVQQLEDEDDDDDDNEVIPATPPSPQKRTPAKKVAQQQQRVVPGLLCVYVGHIVYQCLVNVHKATPPTTGKVTKRKSDDAKVNSSPVTKRQRSDDDSDWQLSPPTKGHTDKIKMKKKRPATPSSRLIKRRKSIIPGLYAICL
jgi:hypothetical protein